MGEEGNLYEFFKSCGVFYRDTLKGSERDRALLVLFFLLRRLGFPLWGAAFFCEQLALVAYYLRS